MNKNIIELREAIKEMASDQKTVKYNRKTVNFKGDRIMSPGQAAWQAQENKTKLRTMYLAYAKARGRSLKEADKNFSDVPMKNIDAVLENFKIDETICID